MGANYIFRNNGIEMPSEQLLQATPNTIRRMGHARNYLMDLDDTLATYDAEFMKHLMADSLREHVEGIDNDDVTVVADQLAKNMHYGQEQGLILSRYMNEDNIASFWNYVTTSFTRELAPQHITFRPSIVKFINFVKRNSLHFGIISNSTEKAGSRVLDIYAERNGMSLHDQSVFLADGKDRKPNPKALQTYIDKIGRQIEGEKSVYIGNSISDLKFAHRIGSVGVILDPENNIPKTNLQAADAGLVKSSIVVSDLDNLKNHLERVMPNYARSIAITVEHGRPNDDHDIDPKAISIRPTDENIYRVVTEGVGKIIGHIPDIITDFENRFGASDRKSIVSIPNYADYFHEATGAILIPAPALINNQYYKNYFSFNRYRVEGDRYFGRGAPYYRHLIPEYETNPYKQNEIITIEINNSYKTLTRTSTHPSDNVEYMLRLATMDNLRGNLLSIYLSTLNILREDTSIPNADSLDAIRQSARQMYEQASKLQYSFMLGLGVDQDAILDSLKNLPSFVNRYRQYGMSNDFPLSHKNPEIENSLLIAMRANEIVKQYLDTDVFVGLSSGGIELASVANMLFNTTASKPTTSVHYPISVHHGLSVWDRDKEGHKMSTTNKNALGLASVRHKKVVICEDNANSGQTISRVADIMNELGASQVNFAVIEIDPTRLLMHHVQQKIGEKHNIGQAATRERPIANYFNPGFMGAVSVVKVLLSDHSINKAIAQDTANKY